MALHPTQYVYQRRGGPLLSWKNGIPPYQSRSGDGMGSLGDDDVFGIQRPLLPRPGAPEYLDDQPDTLGAYGVIPSSSPPIKQRGLGGVPGKKCGCGCKGKKKSGCGKKSVGEYVGTGEYVGMGDDNPVAAAGQTSSSSLGPAASQTGPTGVMTVVPAPAPAPASSGPTMSVSVDFGWFKDHPVVTAVGAYAIYRLFFKK